MMRDDPPAQAILAAAIQHLRDTVLPSVSGRTMFDLRVTISALTLVARELAAPDEAWEHQALKSLLKADGDLISLNLLLAERIEAGTIQSDDPILLKHLRRVTLAKLAVDQPSYPGFRRHRKAEEEP